MQHANFDRIDPNVIPNGLELCFQKSTGYGMDGLNALGILRRQCREGRHAIHTQRTKRLQVCLNTRAAPTV